MSNVWNSTREQNDRTPRRSKAFRRKARRRGERWTHKRKVFTQSGGHWEWDGEGDD